MAMRVWSLDQLKRELKARSEVKAWVITQENTHRRERYFLGDGGALGIDQDRETQSQDIQVQIMVRIPGKSGRQGEVTKKLAQSLALEPQLDAAIASALQTDHQSWEFPANEITRLDSIATADPRISEDMETVLNELTDQIRGVVAMKRPTSFNSAELFLSVHHQELHLSNGIIHRSSRSRIYAESAFSMSRPGPDGRIQSDEYLNTLWSVSLDDLNLNRLFEETSDRASHSLEVRKPETGQYPVIVDSHVLAPLFNDILTHLNAASVYQNLPHTPVGQEFVPGAEGDLLTIVLDPTLEYGADSAALSEHGVAQKPLTLVDRNRVVGLMTDKRYADYLGMAPTSSRGNVIVHPGSLSYEQLTQFAPKVLEVLQFSGLFIEPLSGTFGSEIRLAKLHDHARGTTTYIKGGSLSGSFRENMKGARLSNQQVKRSHFESGKPTGSGYFGPEFALLSNVSIVG